jgi:phosphatidylglycerophosphate synthase
LTLLERLLRQLAHTDGVENITIVAPPGLQLPERSDRIGCPVTHTISEADDGWSMVAAAASSLHGRLLIAAADLVVDQRLFDWLARHDGNAVVAAAGGETDAPLGIFDEAALITSRRAPPPGTRRVRIDSLDTYVRKQRGHVPIHLVRVTSDSDGERAWQALLDHIEKRTKDLPATYFDPPLENVLVRLVAPTPVTPNQVTLATGILGFFVAGLFLNGWLLTGILLAIFVEVLDGVDGKLARIKLMTSKAGELEHVLDFFYENSWYLALGAYFAASGHPWAWGAAWIICAADVADNLSYVYFARRVGGTEWHDYLPSLDDDSPFLRRFRLIAGRRNIYVWLMLPGFVLGWPAAVFAAAIFWAAFTAATHWVMAHLMSRGRRRTAPPVHAAAQARAADSGMRMPPFPVQSRRADSAETQYQPSGRRQQVSQDQ